MSIFRINPSGSLSLIPPNTDDGSTILLDKTSAVTTAEIAGNTYLFIGNAEDDYDSPVSIIRKVVLVAVFILPIYMTEITMMALAI